MCHQTKLPSTLFKQQKESDSKGDLKAAVLPLKLD